MSLPQEQGWPASLATLVRGEPVVLSLRARRDLDQAGRQGARLIGKLQILSAIGVGVVMAVMGPASVDAGGFVVPLEGRVGQFVVWGVLAALALSGIALIVASNVLPDRPGPWLVVTPTRLLLGTPRRARELAWRHVGSVEHRGETIEFEPRRRGESTRERWFVVDAPDAHEVVARCRELVALAKPPE